MGRFTRDLGALLFPERARNGSIPPLDGPWTPNGLIDTGTLLWSAPGLADAVPIDEETMIVAHEASLSRVHIGNGTAEPLTRLPGPATCLVVGGDRAWVGVEGFGVTTVGIDDGRTYDSLRAADGIPIVCPTALAVDERGRLWVAEGSTRRPNSDWQLDLLTGGRDGRIVRFDSAQADAHVVASGLGWPAGLAVTDGETVVVSEAWLHRIVRLGAVGVPRVLLQDLPGYPGALTAGAGGGHWLAVFAPRTRIVDFVMTEPRYRDEMLRRLEPRAWVAPALRTTGHPLEQVQGGQLRVFGKTKPWAPCRSFGLLAWLDADWVPRGSHHSRSDGSRHGVVRGWETVEGVVVVSAGAGEVVLAGRRR